VDEVVEAGRRPGGGWRLTTGLVPAGGRALTSRRGAYPTQGAGPWGIDPQAIRLAARMAAAVGHAGDSGAAMALASGPALRPRGGKVVPASRRIGDMVRALRPLALGVRVHRFRKRDPVTGGACWPPEGTVVVTSGAVGAICAGRGKGPSEPDVRLSRRYRVPLCRRAREGAHRSRLRATVAQAQEGRAQHRQGGCPGHCRGRAGGLLRAFRPLERTGGRRRRMVPTARFPRPRPYAGSRRPFLGGSLRGVGGGAARSAAYAPLPRRVCPALSATGRATPPVAARGPDAPGGAGRAWRPAARGAACAPSE